MWRALFCKHSCSHRQAWPAGCGAGGIQPCCCAGPSARPALSHRSAHAASRAARDRTASAVPSEGDLWLWGHYRGEGIWVGLQHATCRAEVWPQAWSNKGWRQGAGPMELVHTWKLFLMTINLPRGRLAPPSAPHTGALALSEVTPADREGMGEARMGRNCLWDIHSGHVREGQSPGQFKRVQGKGCPRRCQVSARPAEGRS